MGRLNDQIVGYGTATLVIGPRGQSAAKLAAEKMEAPFPVLADPGRQAYRAYGFTKSLWVIQKSGWILLDKEGIVWYTHRSTNPQNSFDEKELVSELGKVRSEK